MLYVVTKILPIVGFEPFGLNGVGMLCIRSFFGLNGVGMLCIRSFIYLQSDLIWVSLAF